MGGDTDERITQIQIKKVFKNHNRLLLLSSLVNKITTKKNIRKLTSMSGTL